MKKCFKCGIEKQLSEYYSHKGMVDGHLGKCKCCTKLDIQKREKLLSTNLEWVESERKRCRERHHRLYSKAQKKYVYKYDDGKKWADRYPEKKKATNRSQNMTKPFNEAEKHHWSYNEEHYRDVIWLTKKNHMQGHRFIIYDQERMMYRRTDNNILLDTKESHEAYIKMCIENN